MTVAPSVLPTIAIVGIGACLPDAPTPEDFWENLLCGHASHRLPPLGRWSAPVDALYAPDTPQADRVLARTGCFITTPPRLEADRLALPSSLLEGLDESLRLALAVARMALEDAAMATCLRQRTDVILGHIALPTERNAAITQSLLLGALAEPVARAVTQDEAQQRRLASIWRAVCQSPITALGEQQGKQGLGIDPTLMARGVASAATSTAQDVTFEPASRAHGVASAATSTAHGVASDPALTARGIAALPAALIAQAFDLQGSTYTLDAACASSLYAIKLACDGLQSGRCDAALVGGLSRPDHLYTQMGFSQLHALSSKGACTPFDARADGLLVGEGAALFVLRRLEDALRDGQHIYGVLRGVGLSNDIGGRLLAPDSEGQLRAMRAAYRAAGWEPQSVDLIECHATGTPVGDAVEFESLCSLWKDRDRLVPCVLGSAKSNIGHLLTAAGGAGLLKVLLALKHQTLPPTAQFQRPSDKINLQDSPFRVLTKPQPWGALHPHPRRAAVSAFGFGGINAHLLVEAYDPAYHSTIPTTKQTVVSADTKVSVASAKEQAVAVVGIAARVGGYNDQEGLLRAFLGEQMDLPRKEAAWWGIGQTEAWTAWQGASPLPRQGLFCETVDLPAGRFRIPPREMAELLPQQLWTLQVADDALRDAQWGREKGVEVPDAESTGVYVGVGLDLHTTDYHLRWVLPAIVKAWKTAAEIPQEEAETERWIASLCDALTPPLNANRTVGGLASIVASRLAREYRLGGPSFVIANEEGSGLRALEIAVRAIQRGEIKQALVAAVDLTSDLRASLLAHRECPFSSDATPRPFDPDHQGSLPADGAVALVLKPLSDALADGQTIYAVLEGIGCAGGDDLRLESDKRCIAHQEACERSLAAPLREAGVSLSSVECIEYADGTDLLAASSWLRALERAYAAEARHAGGGAALRVDSEVSLEADSKVALRVDSEAAFEADSKVALRVDSEVSLEADSRAAVQVDSEAALAESIEFSAQIAAIRSPQKAVLSATSSVTGWAGAASGLLALARAVWGLHHRVLPALASADRGWEPLAAVGRFVEPLRKPESWVHDRAVGPRRALVAANSRDGKVFHLLLRESPVSPRHELRVAWRPERCAPSMAVFAGDTPHAIAQKLHAFAQQTQHQPERPLQEHIADWQQRDIAQPPPALALSALFSSDTPPTQTLARAQTILEQSRNTTNRPREDIFYTPQPLGKSGEIAFVFPGSGAQFPQMGRLEALYWPEILEQQAKENGFLRAQMFSDRVWRQQTRQDALTCAELIFAQVTLGAMVSDILRHSLGIEPDAAIGYSLGESTALFSLRAWRDRDAMLLRSLRSTLFTTDLAGPCLAARELWGWPAHRELRWKMGLVNRSAASLRASLQETPRVYLLIVNTPDACVIGGEAQAVEEWVRVQRCAFVPIEGVTTVHCEVLEPVASAYRALHLHPVTPPEGVRFYSGNWGRSFALTSEQAADSILANARHGIDFPAVIQQAHREGVRLFIEIGPGDGCSRMIGQILGDEPFFARSACVEDSTPPESIARLRAALTAHRLPHLSDAWAATEKTPVLAHTPRLAVSLAVGTPEAPLIPTFVLSEKTYAVRASSWGSTPDPAIERDSMDLVSAKTAQVFQHNGSVFGDQPLQHQEGTNRMASPLPLSASQPMLGVLLALESAEIQAHAAYLRDAQEALAAYTSVASRLSTREVPQRPTFVQPVVMDRAACLRFATGRIGEVWGEAFASIDAHPTRVRLPDEPLMLVDRVLALEGEPFSLRSGRIVTEHDILPEAWYLDGGRLPTCIAVESGQADLMLSGYLGVDRETGGLAMYRLLDAEITFHSGLPRAGEVIHHDIRIERFFKHDETYLFRFAFDSTVAGQKVLTMRNGCAGFFSARQLEEGKGIVLNEKEWGKGDGRIDPRGVLWSHVLPHPPQDAELAALRQGDLSAALGEAFARLPLRHPLTLPGGRDGRMKLLDRVLSFEPMGGRFGIGCLVAEMDIHPDDWFLTCHFVDDMVMPGTLMYECCLHTMRLYLLSLGWLGEDGVVAWEPVAGVKSQLRCRGQVLQSTRKVRYEIHLKELGYNPAPYAIADALMYADDRPIVLVREMSLQLTGSGYPALWALWQREPARSFSLDLRRAADKTPRVREVSSGSVVVLKDDDLFADTGSKGRSLLAGGGPSPHKTDPSQESCEICVTEDCPHVGFYNVGPLQESCVESRAAFAQTPVLYDAQQILEYAKGKPSLCFGPRYGVFDQERFLARLPSPPYLFMDRVIGVEGTLAEMKAGTRVIAAYDIPPDAWYFGAERQPWMPFAVLLEIALQPCGWMAAFMGSAFASEEALHFRNLGGEATVHRLVTPQTGTLRMEVQCTQVSHSGGMIIQHYAMSVEDRNGPVYTGKTYFGFFSQAALAQQVGMRGTKPLIDPAYDIRAEQRPFPRQAPFPSEMLRMLDEVWLYPPDADPQGKPLLCGIKRVNPADWFFQAHFYQDPVWPGSLGLEAMLQLMKVEAMRRFGGSDGAMVAMPPQTTHRWSYRGQVIPTCERVRVEARITDVDVPNKRLRADGLLHVDGRAIYEIKDFALAWMAKK